MINSWNSSCLTCEQVLIGLVTPSTFKYFLHLDSRTLHSPGSLPSALTASFQCSLLAFAHFPGFLMLDFPGARPHASVFYLYSVPSCSHPVAWLEQHPHVDDF